MSEVQRLYFEADEEIQELDIDITAIEKNVETEKPDDGLEDYDVTSDTVARMQQARQMIRGYAIYALSAFKDFGLAEVEEVTLKFGIKMGGKAGIPYITEGSAESNLEIVVKCKFPERS